MFFASELTWNIRDKHMAETAGLVADHLKSRNATPKVVICESLFLPLSDALLCRLFCRVRLMNDEFLNPDSNVFCSSSAGIVQFGRTEFYCVLHL